jgi:chromosome partitioning protein
MSAQHTPIVIFANQKGGQGKTTCTIHAGWGLAQRGYRVLIVDTDAQEANATIALGLKPYPGFYDLVVRGAKPSKVMQMIPPSRYNGDGKGSLAIIGSNSETRAIPGLFDDALAIAKLLRPLADRFFDIVLIDTSPSPSMMQVMLWLAGDYAVFPVVPEALPIMGLRASMRSAEQFAATHTIQVLGIQPTQVRLNTLEHSENLQKLCEEYGDLVWDPISQSIFWSEASSYGIPVFEHVQNSEAARQTWVLVDHVESVLK